MSKKNKLSPQMTLENLLTGHRDIDARLRAAYELGRIQSEIVRTDTLRVVHRLIRMLALKTGMSFDEAMELLEIPKKERKTYRKLNVQGDIKHANRAAKQRAAKEEKARRQQERAAAAPEAFGSAKKEEDTVTT